MNLQSRTLVKYEFCSFNCVENFVQIRNTTYKDLNLIEHSKIHRCPHFRYNTKFVKEHRKGNNNQNQFRILVLLFNLSNTPMTYNAFTNGLIESTETSLYSSTCIADFLLKCTENIYIYMDRFEL